MLLEQKPKYCCWRARNQASKTIVREPKECIVLEKGTRWRGLKSTITSSLSTLSKWEAIARCSVQHQCNVICAFTGSLIASISSVENTLQGWGLGTHASAESEDKGTVLVALRVCTGCCKNKTKAGWLGREIDSHSSGSSKPAIRTTASSCASSWGASFLGLSRFCCVPAALVVCWRAGSLLPPLGYLLPGCSQSFFLLLMTVSVSKFPLWIKNQLFWIRSILMISF